MPSDQLFQLIKSLSRTEKAYFKKFNRKHSKPSNQLYDKLFDLIAKQENFDEDKILKKIKSIKSHRQLSTSKIYLYNNILDCLCDYSFQKNIDAQLYKHLDKIQILNDKGLYHQALKIVYKTQKQAEKYERFLILLKLQEWESQLLHFSGQFDQLQEFLEKGFELDKKWIQEWEAYRKIQQKVVQLFVQSRQYALVREEKDLKLLEHTIQELLEIEKSTKLNVRSAFLLYFGLFHYYYFSKREISKADDYSGKRVALFENHPQFMETSRYSYIHALNISLITKCELKEDQAFHEYLNKLSQLKAESIEEEVGIFEVYAQNYINFLNKRKKSSDNITQLESDLQRFSSKLKEDFSISIHYLFGLYYFQHAVWDKALDYFNQLENIGDPKNHLDFRTAGRLLLLVVHYELENFEFLDAIINSTQYFLRSRSKMYETEKQFLRLFKQVRKLALLDSPLPLFKKAKEKLQNLSEEPYEKAIFSLFNPIDWVESKIQSKKIVDLIP